MPEPVITPEATIGEVLHFFPRAADILPKYFQHMCLGCPGSFFDTLAMGAQIHGLSPDQFKLLMAELQTLVPPPAPPKLKGKRAQA